jgi:orotidine-5'-phosphate decarboxylase
MPQMKPDNPTTDADVHALRTVADFGRDVASRAELEGRVAIAHVEVVGADADAIGMVNAVVGAQMRPVDATVELGPGELLCVMPGVGLDDARRRFATIERSIARARPAQKINVGFAVVGRDEADALLGRPS